MKSKDNSGEKPRTATPYGHYRKRPTPTAEEFAQYFDTQGVAPVLKEFFEGNNATADWVYVNFAPVELEVHQAATIGQAMRRDKKNPDIAAVKKQCPRLAVIATGAELKEIVESQAPKVKELTARSFTVSSKGARKASRSGLNVRSSVKRFRFLPNPSGKSVFSSTIVAKSSPQKR